MRALGVRSKWPGSTGTLAAALESEARGSAFDTQNPSIAQVRGYLIVAQRARLGNLALEAAVPFSLTQTEVDVLRAVAQGKSNAAIALERGVTRNAVERRLMSAYEKLDVKTRGEAIAKISRLLRPE
jgi:DNA-binding NarL/FixJ family response regulator